MGNLQITRNGLPIQHNSFLFPGGEVGVKIAVENSVAFIAKTLQFAPAEEQVIVAKMKSPADVLELAMLVDALRNIDETPIHVFMPYVPYARQDRVCDAGESFSVKAFAGLINSLKLKKITIVDPHSGVTPAVLDNVKVIPQLTLIQKWNEFGQRVLKGVTFVSPDAGANKKTADIAGYFGHDSFIRADKLRELSTGKIKETIVYCEDLKGRDVVICDDICDGGKTFVELAKVLKAKNCGKVVLFVTHGIFSKGTGALLENGIDEIWTTDSLYESKVDLDPVKILKLNKFL